MSGAMNGEDGTLINLVDEAGRRTGSIGKMTAHVEGRLHEAFSIFVFNERDELLLQKRAGDKYHSGGLWANTCCSHARYGEPLEDAVHERLKYEMGFDCALRNAFSLIYTASLVNGLIENELDYVFLGKSDAVPKPNPEEVGEFKWMKTEDLKKDMERNPSSYAEWLRIILNSPDFPQY